MLVAGVDEVGRGCLAGPVMAAELPPATRCGAQRVRRQRWDGCQAPMEG